jgi:hypothetical protein
VTLIEENAFDFVLGDVKEVINLHCWREFLFPRRLFRGEELVVLIVEKSLREDMETTDHWNRVQTRKGVQWLMMDWSIDRLHFFL